MKPKCLSVRQWQEWALSPHVLGESKTAGEHRAEQAGVAAWETGATKSQFPGTWSIFPTCSRKRQREGSSSPPRGAGQGWGQPEAQHQSWGRRDVPLPLVLVGTCCKTNLKVWVFLWLSQVSTMEHSLPKLQVFPSTALRYPLHIKSLWSEWQNKLLYILIYCLLWLKPMGLYIKGGKNPRAVSVFITLSFKHLAAFQLLHMVTVLSFTIKGTKQQSRKKADIVWLKSLAGKIIIKANSQ